MPEITVVVPTQGRRATLEGVLGALGASTGVESNAFELIVVTDADGPGPERVAPLIEALAYPVRHLRAEREGVSAKRNVGWRAARSAIVLFLDDDVVPVPSLLKAHLGEHRMHPEPDSAVLGLVRWAPGLRITPFMRWLDDGMQFEYASIEGAIAGWGHFYTANVSVKRELLARVGGFDEECFPFGYEDLDLGLRMRDAGMRLYFCPRALGDHHREPTLEEWRARMAQIARMERAFVAKHPSVAPYFHARLAVARTIAPQRPWGAAAARVIPPTLPWLGRRIWWRAETYFAQQLATPFMTAWEEATTQSDVTSAPAGGDEER